MQLIGTKYLTSSGTEIECKIVRVKDLQPGDNFILDGIIRAVSSLQNDILKYTTTSNYGAISAKSMQYVEKVIN